jgi:hypothetical protein
MSDRDRLLAHEYDGIEEYDNPLPGWWSWIFVATIVFSVGVLALLPDRPGAHGHRAVRRRDARGRRAPGQARATAERRQ